MGSIQVRYKSKTMETVGIRGFMVASQAEHGGSIPLTRSTAGRSPFRSSLPPEGREAFTIFLGHQVNSLFESIDKLHTTELGVECIKRNLGH